MRRTAPSLVSCSTLVVALAAAAPRGAAAQGLGRPAPPHRWTVTPEIGAWWQEASSREVNEGPGLLVGLRVARAIEPQIHFSAAAAFLRLDNSRTIEIVGGGYAPTRTEYYRVEMVPLSLGMDWVAGFGRTSASVGVDAGALLRREPIDHVIGSTDFGNESQDDWSRHLLLGGRLGVRYALRDRVALQGTLGAFLGGSYTRRVLTTAVGVAWQL